ncbi:MAG: DEAD/DEAH box helicase [Candidatus Thorarchaeota archaeon]|jgi:superfamily II DNA or RNA helicase
MLLVETDTYTVVQDADVRERAIIKQACQARPKGYKYMPAYKDGVWDGYISLYKNNRFPAGLTPFVRIALKDAGIHHEVEFNVHIPQPSNSITINGYELRDYQQDAVTRALAATRGVLHMATNAGKTLIIASIIKSIGYRAVVIVPTRPLLTQTADSLEQMLGIPIGRFGAGSAELQDVTVSTMASLPKLVKADLSGNATVIIDECHHTKAATLFDNLFVIPGPYRYGLSGTPMTLDVLSDLKLYGATGPVIYTVKNMDLIEEGWSVPPDVRFLKVDEPDLWDANYDTAYRECIVSNDARNKMIANVVESADKPVLILVNWIEHLVAMTEHFSFRNVTGQDSAQIIQQSLDDMRNGKLDVLAATDIFGEGIDVPAIRTLVLAGGGKSHIKLLQKIGRGLRQAEDKDKLVVYDFLDSTNKHLLNHSERRYKLYKEEGFDVSIAEL